jgi:hypothetical protein
MSYVHAFFLNGALTFLNHFQILLLLFDDLHIVLNCLCYFPTGLDFAACSHSFIDWLPLKFPR